MASDARKTEWEREIAEQAVRDARAEFADRLAKARRERDEARALAVRLKKRHEKRLAAITKAVCERDEARERERRALAGRNDAMERLAEAARDRDEARAERDLARKSLHVAMEAMGGVRGERDKARAEAAALRELADAAARRIALREAAAMPERVTAGEAFEAEGIPPGDMLGDRAWLREYRAARALRGGGGA